MMQLPGEHRQQFVLERPFVPRTKPNQLSVVHVAGNDGVELREAHALPGARSVGRAVARARRVARSRPTRTSARSSRCSTSAARTVVRGAAQLIPIGNSIFYVRPIYVEGDRRAAAPRWNFVAVTYGERAVLDTSVSDAVNNLLADTTPAAEQQRPQRQHQHADDHADHDALHHAGHPSPRATPRSRSCSPRRNQLTATADQALANGDLAAYQADIKEQQTLIQARRAARRRAPPRRRPRRPSASTSTSTSTPTTGASTTDRRPPSRTSDAGDCGPGPRIVGGSGDCYYLGSVNSRRGRPTPGPWAGDRPEL